MTCDDKFRAQMLLYPPDYCRQRLLTVSASMTPAQRHRINRALQRFAQVFPHGLSDYQKILLLYSVITKTIQYDEADIKDPLSYTAAGPLLLQKGVCMGISELITMMCSRLGIRCLTVIGYATYLPENGGHAWNMVEIPTQGVRRFYHLDATWDLGRDPEEWRYFLLSDDQIFHRKHAWLCERYPSCPTPAPRGWHTQTLNFEGVEILCRFFKQVLSSAAVGTNSFSSAV